MTTKSPLAEDVKAGLRAVLRHGLPLTAGTPPAALLELRGVVGRAVDPTDPASRAEALDGLLRSLVARYPDQRLAPGVRILFGLNDGAGLNLMKRRALAAEAVVYEADHFRKRIEPAMVEQLTAELLADADRFRLTKLIAPRLAAATARQPITTDPFAWEVTAHEEALTRVWAAVYALRADLLLVERLISLDEAPAEIADALVSAAWRWGLARNVAVDFADIYPGEASPDDLMFLAGWCPMLTPEEAVKIRAAAEAAGDADAFRTAVAVALDLDQTWVRPYLDAAPTDPIPESTDQ
ncbi:hypothetical protein [Glycomyces buryatensis]|uniref:Uncharacterized protein n=1 Tax=Glycomyces buryatensis TaxID=2570927 RepID=A0A4V4HRX4_9ACTN|nr:hypothetical protein [Glycomyces buryatensis]THV39656.1 hypothetical protein FAB82_17460 [Glycomyces buryatensis]